jgi:hypothetical protein
LENGEFRIPIGFCLHSFFGSVNCPQKGVSSKGEWMLTDDRRVLRLLENEEAMERLLKNF